MAEDQHVPWASNPDRQAKIEIIRGYCEHWRLPVFIETGSFNGAAAALELTDLVERVFVIDMDRGNVASLKERIGERGAAFYGDSAEWLPWLLASLRKPAIFFLDAHLWREHQDWTDDWRSPLLHELSAIRTWPHAAQSVVLIDDLRMMADGSIPEPGWPSAAHLRILANGLWNIEEAADIMRLTPR